MAVIDLNDIKTQIKSLLDTANDTAASTDLSGSLVNRVNKVLKVNPAKIPIQASYYPAVTIYTDNKLIELDSMAATMSAGKRQATISLKIMGLIWNSNITTELEDPADEDCENLMENIEQILRDDYTLNGAVDWSKPTGVSYHDVPVDEEVHLRAGMLDLECTVRY